MCRIKTRPTTSLATNSHEILNLRRLVKFYRSVQVENPPSEEREWEDATSVLVAAAFLVVDSIDIDSTECNEKSGGAA
ncbi:hypothetical protein SGGMMB4_05919 (plasmid) [Sodalis glossinidius str. 'morsitans']|nr:hypothetical protein [Sodalis glossinidius]CRL46947.1 hypothetical protein SGGMMB4_05919 [Sodalis glossinidius str. 'morsitans']